MPVNADGERSPYVDFCFMPGGQYATALHEDGMFRMWDLDSQKRDRNDPEGLPGWKGRMD